ncbi:hypothetical protein HK405_002474 [Cladochytrium tenue]|nr:hypothetical protein HK405_002474 [Cladochytrium tenue]
MLDEKMLSLPSMHILNHEEGVKFKNPDSAYVLDSDWIKLEPDYTDHLGNVLDLLIVAFWRWPLLQLH